MATRPKTKTTTERPKTAKGAAAAALEAKGIEWVCAQIEQGEIFMRIAAECGVAVGSLWGWIEANPERAARARQSRVKSAAAYEEKASSGIDEASDPFELAKAKELAHHYRWKASRLDPRGYGDRVTQEHTGPGGGPLVALLGQLGKSSLPVTPEDDE